MSKQQIELKISLMRTFVTVAETRNYRKAGERLLRSQPAVSLAIKEIESLLDQRLFTKSTPLELTSFGGRLLSIARKMVTDYDRSMSQVAGLASGFKGTVAVAAVPSIGASVIPSALQDFMNHYPDVEVKVWDDTAEIVTRMVMEGKVDFGIASLPEPNPLVSFQALTTDHFGLVCHNNHDLSSRESLEWSEIGAINMIENGTFALLDGDQKVVLKSHLYVSNTTSLFGMIEAGLGVTVLPKLAFKDRPSLRFIPLNNPVRSRRVGIIQLRSGEGLHPAAEKFRQLVSCQDLFSSAEPGSGE